LFKVRLLSAAAVYFNVLAVTEFGGRSGPVRQAGLIEQVVAAAFQTFQGTDPHPSPLDKAAMLLRGITQGHPFTDANKRTGFLVAIYYLDRVGFVLRPDLSPAEVVSFCRRVSAGEVRDLGTIAAALQGWTEPRREQFLAP
jgi:prophage maintenance system killer protein